MTTQNPPPDPGVAYLLRQIRVKTVAIIRQQEKADAGEFTSMGAALGLQKLHQERNALQARLPKLRVVE